MDLTHWFATQRSARKISVCFVIILYLQSHTDVHRCGYTLFFRTQRWTTTVLFVLLKQMRERQLKSVCAKIELCLIKFALLHAYLALRRFGFSSLVLFCFVGVISQRNSYKRNRFLSVHLMGSKWKAYLQKIRTDLLCRNLEFVSIILFLLFWTHATLPLKKKAQQYLWNNYLSIARVLAIPELNKALSPTYFK